MEQQYCTNENCSEDAAPGSDFCETCQPKQKPSATLPRWKDLDPFMSKLSAGRARFEDAKFEIERKESKQRIDEAEKVANAILDADIALALERSLNVDENTGEAKAARKRKELEHFILEEKQNINRKQLEKKVNTMLELQFEKQQVLSFWKFQMDEFEQTICVSFTEEIEEELKGRLWNLRGKVKKARIDVPMIDVTDWQCWECVFYGLNKIDLQTVHEILALRGIIKLNV
jgi:hypothetical protein